MSVGLRLKLFVLALLLLLGSFFVVDVLRGGESQRGSLVVVLVTAIVAASVLSLLGSRWLARELALVTEAAGRMAAGDLDVRTQLEGDHEVARLGGALDRLAVGLAGAIGDLRAERDLVTSILESMEEGVLLLDAHGNIALVNPTLRNIFMVTKDVKGRRVIDVVRHSSLTELLDRARSSGSALTAELEVAGLKPRRLLVRAAPLATDKRALLAVFVDVTDLRRLESMRRDFVANVSHELRTPVTAVQSAAETLANGALSDEVAAKRFVAIIERNSERLRSLIDDLLDLSRIESKEFRLRPEPIALHEAVAHVFAMVHERGEKVGVELSNQVRPDEALVLVDQRAIEQVLLNLIDNAVKYCAGARVTVRAERRDDHAIALIVSDTGPGIAPSHLDRLFERFYRVDASRSRELGGTGLGLSIVKHLVEASGGTVTVSSEVKTLGAARHGTTFTVKLPEADESKPHLPVS